jgi:hypothetical protein
MPGGGHDLACPSGLIPFSKHSFIHDRGCHAGTSEAYDELVSAYSRLCVEDSFDHDGNPRKAIDLGRV